MLTSSSIDYVKWSSWLALLSGVSQCRDMPGIFAVGCSLLCVCVCVRVRVCVCTQARLSKFNIYLGDAEPPKRDVHLNDTITANPVCYSQNTSIVIDTAAVFVCAAGRSVGRYLTVQLIEDGYNASDPVLMLCQVRPCVCA